MTVNISLAEVLEQMPGYEKFMKDIVTRKSRVTLGKMDVTHQCSAIVTSTLVQKRENPSAFFIPYTIGSHKFTQALYDLGASINAICYFKKLDLGTPQLTTIRLLMANQTMKRQIGIIYNVLVKVDRFIYPTNIVILNYEIDKEVLIILGRPFLATKISICDVEK